MTAEIQASQKFEERLFQKIRDSIGELMTEKELKELVDKSVQKLFFDPRKELVKDNRYYNSTTEVIKPSKFHELIQELVEPSLKAEIAKWLNEHPEVVKEAIDQALEGGLAQACLRAINAQWQSSFANMQISLQNSLQNALLHR